MNKIIDSLTLLVAPGSVVELRVMTNGSGTVSGYFNDFDKMAQAAEHWSGKAPGVYFTLNPVDPALLARANNKWIKAKNCSGDKDIVKRVWLPMDFDAVRPAGISSTNKEHEWALARAQNVKQWLADQGWPLPVLGDSGNGAHLLYRIDLPNNDKSTQLLKSCLETLAFQFDDAKVNVDKTVFNAARIWKVYGTLSKKGEQLPDRPHRTAIILENPTQIEVVSTEKLEALAKSLPGKTEQTPAQSKSNSAFSVSEWLSKNGLEVVREGPWSGGYRWILKNCPWNPDHTNLSAYVLQMSSGAVAAGCHHNGCSDNDWHNLRGKFEPVQHLSRAAKSPSQDPVVTSESDHRDGIETIQLSKVDPKPVKWARKGYWVTGKINLIGGDPGFGKTFLEIDGAARMSTGSNWPEGGTAPMGNVIILTAEDGLADTIVPRLIAAGADLDKIHAVQSVHVQNDGKDLERMFCLTEDIGRLESLVEQLHPIAIYIDPLSAYMGETDTHKDAAVRRVLAPLAAFAEKHDIAVIGIMHFSKAEMKAIYKVNGSIGFAAVPRSVVVVVPDPNEEDPHAPGARRLFVSIKMNVSTRPPTLAFSIDGTDADAKVKWEGTVDSVDVDAAIRGPEHGKGVGKNDATDWLRNTLQEAGGELAADQIYELAKQDGISRSTVWRAKEHLKIKSRKEGFGEEGQWFWALRSPQESGGDPAANPPKSATSQKVRPFEATPIETPTSLKGLNETLATRDEVPKDPQNAKKSKDFKDPKGSQVKRLDWQCPTCHGSGFWIGDGEKRFCQVCHPPAPGAIREHAPEECQCPTCRGQGGLPDDDGFFDHEDEEVPGDIQVDDPPS